MNIGIGIILAAARADLMFQDYRSSGIRYFNITPFPTYYGVENGLAITIGEKAF